jgi:hypothetical protein
MKGCQSAYQRDPSSQVDMYLKGGIDDIRVGLEASYRNRHEPISALTNGGVRRIMLASTRPSTATQGNHVRWNLMN